MSAPFSAVLGRLFEPLETAPGILIAVSGGPDSMALLHLLARWKEAGARPALFAATVDHRLRPESAAEAALVGEAAARLHIPHVVLPWEGVKPSSRLQEAARIARYRLLAAAARESEATHLVTAHTLDDQAETVLMRLARGSGLTGLAAMRPMSERGGLVHARPLLDVPKAALVDLCRREGWPFVEDPSNTDETFARVRWRKVAPLLAAEGLTAERLARLAERAQRAEAALDLTAEAAFTEALRHAAEDRIVLDAAVLARVPAEIAVRMLARGLAAAGAPGEHGRLVRVETAAQRLREAFAQRRTARSTLRGCLVALDSAGMVVITPEPERRRGRDA